MKKRLKNLAKGLDFKKTVTFYLPVDLINQLKRDAQRAGISLSIYVEQLLTAEDAKKM